MARMRERQHAAAIRPTSPVPAVAPEADPLPEADADGVTIVPPERLPDDLNLGVDEETVAARVKAAAVPPPDKVRRAAGAMWWAAQSPVIAEDQRAKLLEARATVLQEAALA